MPAGGGGTGSDAGSTYAGGACSGGGAAWASARSGTWISSSSSSQTDWWRSAGSFDSARSRTRSTPGGRRRLRALADGTCPFSVAVRISPTLRPLNSGVSVRISKIRTPIA